MNRISLDLPILKESIRKNRLLSESSITGIGSDPQTARNGVCVETVTGTSKLLQQINVILFCSSDVEISCCLINPNTNLVREEYGNIGQQMCTFAASVSHLSTRCVSEVSIFLYFGYG